MNPEILFAQYAAQCPIEIPPEAVDEELQKLVLEEKQRMQYETLTGAAIHLAPQQELDERMEVLQAEALCRARERLVLEKILREQPLPVTREDLEAEAEAIAQRQGTTVEALRRFFEEDLSMLQRDLKQRKAMAWACAQMEGPV